MRVCIVTSSGQNVFFADILDAFGEALRKAGATVEEAVDCFPPLAADLVYLYVPHEYHPLVHELAHPTPVQLGRSIVICTEQPGTSWFETAAEIAVAAGAVLDINPLGVRELRRRGIAAEHAPLGRFAAWDAWRGNEEDEREVDLAFLGAHSKRRAGALARCAPALSGRRAEIHLVDSAQPHKRGSTRFLTGERRLRLLGASKLLLNVHRSEFAYMEWHRVLSAILGGCVVLSEHSLGIEPLVPGEHFVSAGYDDLPHVLDALLDEPGRLAEIRRAAYDLVCAEMPADLPAEALLSAAERASEAPLPAWALSSSAAVPMPRSLPPRKPEWEARPERLGERFGGEQAPVRGALKDILARTRGLERRIEELSAPGAAEDVVEQLGPDPGEPEVSVLLTVHDYADLVGGALRSVALSDLREVEVVAVDDASTDGSAEAVRAASAELPWLPVRLVRRGRNRGLAAARNLAAEHARAELLFVLDADNAVAPRGLGLLAAALSEHPDAAFAYGLLEVFDVSGSVDLKSWFPWDPEQLRYGNYVDAMAMIRRSLLEEVGGYPDEAALGGWEDFAVWLAMADAGLRGIRVPDFVGRYRAAPHSMVSLTDVDHSAAWAALLRRYPVLTRSAAG